MFALLFRRFSWSVSVKEGIPLGKISGVPNFGDTWTYVDHFLQKHIWRIDPQTPIHRQLDIYLVRIRCCYHVKWMSVYLNVYYMLYMDGYKLDMVTYLDKPHFHDFLKNPQVSIDQVAWLNMMHVKGKGPQPHRNVSVWCHEQEKHVNI